MKPGDDIFVFLHKFEYNMKAYNVSHYDWILYLPSLLHGPYSQAYYNNVTADMTFHTTIPPTSPWQQILIIITTSFSTEITTLQRFKYGYLL